MTWAKLDDRFPDHEKIAPLSNSAFRLHVTALCFAAAQLTDGVLVDGALRRIGWASTDLAADVQELVAAQLWETHAQGYVIHDFLEYNPSRAEVEAHRQQVSAERSKAGKAGMASRWHNKNNKTITNGITNAYQNDNPGPGPVPVVNNVKNNSKEEVVQRHAQQATAPAYDAFFQARGGAVNSMDGEQLGELEALYGTDTTVQAIRYCNDHRKQSFLAIGYIAKTLAGWHKDGNTNGNGHNDDPVTPKKFNVIYPDGSSGKVNNE
jgi:hypothetical protein